MAKYLILPILVIFILSAQLAQAVSVAVFPVEDLTQGRNGVNYPLTDFLRLNLEERGLEVIQSDRLINFMARNRVRWLGFLGTDHIYQVGEDLGADFVLLGTVSQHQELPMATLGMVLTLVRTSDAHTVWTEVGGVSKADISNFLAINEPKNIDDLMPVLAQQLFGSWPSALEARAKHPCLLVENTRLSPLHVKPGEEVSCTVRLRPIAGGGETLSQVLLMVGDDNYLDMQPESADTYAISWYAPEWDGFLPVSLILRYDSGRSQIFYIGNYQVDNSAPTLALKILGKKVNDYTMFNDRLPIIPVWQAPEPLSHWTLVVQNANGGITVGTEGKGTLPNRFIWKGQRPDGRKADDGLYDIILKTWDRADNLTVAREKVLLRNNPPVPVINAVAENEKLIVTLNAEDDIPVDFWSAEVMYSNGEELLQSQGSKLPVEILIPFPPPADQRKLECVVSMKDVLSNKVQKKIPDLMKLVRPAENGPEAPTQEEWISEF